MRVFVTGASGWIGSAVVPQLLGAGHAVVGLARSDESAAALETAGVSVVRGTLDDLDVLADTAGSSDGVVHLAFKHDLAFSGDFAGAADADRRAVEAFGDALAGTGKPLVIASGLLGLAPGGMATEADGHGPVDAGIHGDGPSARQATAEFTLQLAGRGVRSSVLRLPPTVHGRGDTGFVASLVGLARAHGVAGYLGDGSVRWPAVHRDDAARLFRLAAESAPAGTTLHGAAEEGVPLGEVADEIGRRLGLPTRAVPAAEAADHFLWLAPIVALDTRASSAVTRRAFDWEPTGPGLLEDLAAGAYTDEPD
jgi:nucleoside-diphosphate-sugar epimerase